MTQLPLDKCYKPCFAGFWKRYAAFLIDSLLIGAASKIVLNLTVHRWAAPDLVGDSWWYQLVKLAIFLAYFAGTTLALDGQTVGKFFLGLRVININTGLLDRETLLLRELAGRTALYFAPFLAIVLLFTPQRQHLLDLLCETAVVDLRQVAYFKSIQGQTVALPDYLTSSPSDLTSSTPA